MQSSPGSRISGFFSAIALLALCFALPSGPAYADDDKEVAVDIAHLFLFSLRSAKWKQAFTRLSPRLQEMCGGTPNKMAENVFRVFEAKMTKWEYWDPHYVEKDGDRARTSFTTYREGDLPPLNVAVLVERIDDEWLIQDISVGNKDMCPG